VEILFHFSLGEKSEEFSTRLMSPKVWLVWLHFSLLFTAYCLHWPVSIHLFEALHLASLWLCLGSVLTRRSKWSALQPSRWISSSVFVCVFGLILRGELVTGRRVANLSRSGASYAKEILSRPFEALAKRRPVATLRGISSPLLWALRALRVRNLKVDCELQSRSLPKHAGGP